MYPRPHETETIRPKQGAFTLIELCVVIATVAVLAAVLLPALAGTRTDMQTVQARNNLRQLTAGWTMYAGDNRDKLATNAGLSEQSANSNDPRFQPGGAWSQWCPGRMNMNNEAWSTDWIKVGEVYPYVNDPAVYHDPSDRSRWPLGASYGHLRVRSFSMNCWLNPLPSADWNSIKGYTGTNMLRVFRKLSSIDIPGGTSQLWIFISEEPTTINDGLFVCDPHLEQWVDLPATCDGGGSCISYADGHVDTKFWHYQNVPSTADLHWLQQRSTVLDSAN
jgi:type II secretory pathway pseudopilin PulG